MPTWIKDRARGISVVVALAVLAAAVGIAYVVTHDTKMKHATVYFPSTIGIYKGTSVRVLGVPVGKVDSVTPIGAGNSSSIAGTQVRVTLSYKASVPVPAATGVAQITPSIVSDRYLQFTESYTSGPTLADHATITADKTEVPVELDQIFGSLNNLNVALGPNGANKDGALSQLIDVGAANLKGNGAQFNATLKGFSAAINTLSNSRDALFGTITSLQKFTTTLADDDSGVRTINGQLAQVSAQLAGERQDLGAALANLATALTQVQSFISTNKDTLTHDISGLTSVTSGLVSEQQAIKEILDEAPDALYNLVLSFSRQTQTCGYASPAAKAANQSTCTYGALVTRLDNTGDPSYLVCSLLSGVAGNLSSALSGLTPQLCAQILGSAAASSSKTATTPKTSTGSKAPTTPTPSTSSGGGLLGGLLGGLSGLGASPSPSSGTSSGGSSTCTGLLCGVLNGGL